MPTDASKPAGSSISSHSGGNAASSVESREAGSTAQAAGAAAAIPAASMAATDRDGGGGGVSASRSDEQGGSADDEEVAALLRDLYLEPALPDVGPASSTRFPVSLACSAALVQPSTPASMHRQPAPPSPAGMHLPAAAPPAVPPIAAGSRASVAACSTLAGPSRNQEQLFGRGLSELAHLIVCPITHEPMKDPCVRQTAPRTSAPPLRVSYRGTNAGIAG